MCLASAGGQSDIGTPGRSQNNRCTPAARRSEPHLQAHTHTPCGVSIGSSRLVSDGGIWQVVRRWFLFFQKGKRLKAGGLIISSLLTET